LDKPKWTGDGLLSRAVNGAIANPLLFGAMRVLAKGAMRRSAREKGVDWQAHCDALAAREQGVLKPLAKEFAERSGLGMGPYEDEEEKNSTTSKSPYPDYYCVPFHSYTRGNLEWEAAREVEPASLAIAMRTFSSDAPPASDAQATAEFAERAMARMRGQITGCVREYMCGEQKLPPPRRILDVGCSTGISTRWLGWEFEGQEGGGGDGELEALVGLDLSPYFLAVAEEEERRRRGEGEEGSNSGSPPSAILGLRAAPKTRTRPAFVHGLAESTPFADGSFDLVAYNFVAHECPGRAIDAFCAEAKRLLVPGKGVVCFSDNDPQSATIQNLPPAIFTLMKSTEPWSDEYYSFSLEDALRRAGFRDVVKVASDHRHRVVMGVAPLE
jgi:SAM-dependent methyltransferase